MPAISWSATLPLAFHGMCNYCTIKGPLLLKLCVYVRWCLVTTLKHVNNVAQTPLFHSQRKVEAGELIRKENIYFPVIWLKGKAVVQISLYLLHLVSPQLQLYLLNSPT